jgi:antibiotic biosynthesis monooxygenase (ABM) superfamily enzyme
MTQVPREEFLLRSLFQEPDDPRKEPRARQYIVLWVVLGAVVAGFIALLNQSPGVFLPAWGLCSLVLWAVGSSVKEDRR